MQDFETVPVGTMDRLNEAEKDAARYRYLVESGSFRIASLDMGSNHTWTGIGRHIGKGATIDEAIDGKIRERKEE